MLILKLYEREGDAHAEMLTMDPSLKEPLSPQRESLSPPPSPSEVGWYQTRVLVVPHHG